MYMPTLGSISGNAAKKNGAENEGLM